MIISNVYAKFWEAYSVVIKAFVFNKLKFSKQINKKQQQKQKKPNKQNFTLPGLLIVPQTI